MFEVSIRTTPEQLWEAITKPEFTRRYARGTDVESTWLPGAPIRYRDGNGCIHVDGVLVEVVYARKLVQTWLFVEHAEARRDRPSRVTWEIQPMGDTCKLTVTHDDFDGETKTYEMAGRGWPTLLSDLKTLVETGESGQPPQTPRATNAP